MRFERSFSVEAPLDEVAAFHGSAASLKAITPPMVPMRLLEIPETLAPGQEMSFKMWLGPVPVVWRAGLEALGDAESASGEVAGFVDRQLQGPFESWVHTHRFVAEGPGRTRVEDRIEARVRKHLLWGPLAYKMWLGLPVLFAYRRWKTRRLLERS